MTINRTYSPVLARSDVSVRDVAAMMFFQEPKRLAALCLQLELHVNERFDSSRSQRWVEQCKAAAEQLAETDRARVRQVLQTLVDALA